MLHPRNKTGVIITPLPQNSHIPHAVSLKLAVVRRCLCRYIKKICTRFH